MFGRSKPVLFEPYGRRRTRGRLPRWLVLLLTGIAIGAAGVVVVQERYLPPRLSASESAELTRAFQQADAERLQLKQELADTSKRLVAAVAGRKGLADELAAHGSVTERLRDDIAALVAALPPDPRGGSVAVRAATFDEKGGALAYDIVLTRNSDKPMNGVLQLSVAGESAKGVPTTTPLKPVALTIAGHQIVRGSQPLPDGFKPRQVTIEVLDRPGGKRLGMRVILVT